MEWLEFQKKIQKTQQNKSNGGKDSKPPQDPDFEAMTRLSEDLRDAAKLMTRDEARFIVDAYYQIQEYRIGAAAQIRSLIEPASEEGDLAGDEDSIAVQPASASSPQFKNPARVLDWLQQQTQKVENGLKRALDIYSNANPIGQWSREFHGIGPVIAAGLLAHIDITKAPTVGHIWRFAGLDPTTKWSKGEKRPWNAGLKCLCWKIGESFVKVSGNPEAFYGQVYLERKDYESAKNEAGDYLEQAKLGAKRVNKTTEAYKSYVAGKLPLGHLHSRAKRYAVKLFLSHWHGEAYREHYKTEPPLPYPISMLGHAHNIAAPV